MDVDENLREQLELANRIIDRHNGGEPADESEVDRLAELILALDEWIRKGGMLPRRWRDA